MVGVNELEDLVSVKLRKMVLQQILEELNQNHTELVKTQIKGWIESLNKKEKLLR